MIHITPLLNQLDLMIYSAHISAGDLTDKVLIEKVDQAWEMLQHPNTADSIVYYDLLDEIRILVAPLIADK